MPADSQKPSVHRIRPADPADRDALCALVAAAGVFSDEEVACAQDIIDEALAEPGPQNYQILVAELPESGTLVGYACYSRTPFTRAASDLYWLATHPQHRRGGAARRLIAAMETELRRQGIIHVRVETSGTGGYSAARSFYESLGYENIARIPDFYKPDDALYTYYKRLPEAAV